MAFFGVASCIYKNININGRDIHEPDIPDLVTYKVVPYGLGYPVPDQSNAQCLIEFYTENDMLAELEAHPGILMIFEYGVIDDEE